MYSMCKSYEKWLRYNSFIKLAPNHRSLTLPLMIKQHHLLLCMAE